MRRRAIVLAMVASVALTACIAWPTTTIELPAAAAVHVSELGGNGGAPHDFPADSDTARRLKSWIDANRSGWTPLLATPPVRGLFVSAGGVSLQFIDESVIVTRRDGVFHKKVAPADYAFLRS